MQLPALTVTFVFLLLSCCTKYARVHAQFGPPCTVATPPPPELRPLDSDASLLPRCSLSGGRTQKSAISETKAQRLALCNSFCTSRVFTGNFVLLTAQRQSLPGYPVWLLATQSYLLSDDGTTTDCILGDNVNGCTGYPGCNQFTPPSDIFNPVPGGYKEALDCKLGCMLKFETPSSTITDCGSTCKSNCESVDCQCMLSFFGGGCERNVVGPCGRFCNAGSCEEGCTDANSYSSNTPTYPSSANPTQAPVVTRIGEGTRFMINITNSIPSGLSNDLGLSTLIVRVLDNSSATMDDYTYYVLENGFEVDLAPFTCRRVEISFAVATEAMGISSYSPATTVELLASSTPTPDQLTTFNYTVEQDTRRDFYQNVLLHLTWDPPHNVELAESYTISLMPTNNPPRCGSVSVTITNNSLTGYTIRSNTTSDPPLNLCGYQIRIEINPRSGEAASRTTDILPYFYPNENDNVQSNCTAIVNRNTNSYDAVMYVTFDELFTPAVISAIENLRLSAIELNEQLNVVNVASSRTISLDAGIERGPATFVILFDNLPEVLATYRYALSVGIRWIPTDLPAIDAYCEVLNVGPIPPDPVENIVVTFGEAFPFEGRYFVTLRFNWSAPSFQGRGIANYEVWLSTEPAPPTTERGLQQLQPDSRTAQTKENFASEDGNFTLYFQLRAVGQSQNVRGPWSTPILINVSSLERPAPEQIADNEINVTRFVYSVSDITDLSETLTLSVELSLNVVVPGISNGTVGTIQVYIGNEAAPDNDNAILTNVITEPVSASGGMTTTIQATFSTVAISGFGAQLYLQVRGRTIFNSIQSTGDWSNPKLLTVRHVPPPTNVGVTDVRDIRRTLVNSGQGLRVSLALSLSWDPPVEFDSLSGYQVILSRHVVGRFVMPSSIAESTTATISASNFNSTSAVQFTNLELNTATLEEVQLSLQMRTLASDIIEGGGEWSTPPVPVTLPSQPPDVADNDFNITRFTYRPTTGSAGQLTVLVEVHLSFALARGTQVDVYIGTSRVSDQSGTETGRLMVSADGTGFESHTIQGLQEISNQDVFVQVRFRSTNIVGAWSTPKQRNLTPVLPPTNIDFLPVRSRFRRSVVDSTLIVEALNVDLSWVAPPTSPTFAVTGFDALYTDTIVSGYVQDPHGQRMIENFESTSQSASAFAGARIMFLNSSFDDDVTLFIQMRTKADILPATFGGNWSVAETVAVPTQPRNMTDENFNVTSYAYSLETSDDGMSAMLNVSLNMSLVTPPITGGEIKELHVSVGTEKLSAVATANFIPINVEVEDKAQNRTLSVGVPLQPEASLPGTDLFVQVRGMSSAGALGDWAEAERFILPSVPSPENITAKVNSAKEETALLVRLEVILQWLPSEDLDASPGVRRRRQTDTRDANDIIDYEVLISTESGIGVDYAEAPTTRFGVFTRRFGDGNLTRAIFPVDIQLATADDLVNDTLYLQMRTVTTLTSSGGEWSEPMTLVLDFPPPSQASLTAVIAGTTTPLAIIIAVIIVIIITIVVFLAYRTKKIKDEYQVARGEVNWDYDWNADMPAMAPGMVEGKEPLLDEWEIPTTDVIVEDHLGEGAFGYVFKGVIRGPLRNPKLSNKLKQTIGLPVAIKLLKDTATRKERSDFLTEIEMMKKISEGYNNHMVNLVGCVTIQEPLCLITEYVPHGDLLDYLRNQRKKNAARRRQARLLHMNQIRIESDREYYEEMIRQAKITQSAQSEDSDLGRSTTGTGYSELVALREMEDGQEASASEPSASVNEALIKETEIDASTEGVAIVGVAMMGGEEVPDNSSEIQLLREESSESDGGVQGSRLIENGVLNPITEEVEDGVYPEEKAAPYLEAKNEYSHLDPKPAESAPPAAAVGEGPSGEDEELLRALMQTEQIGELEANDLMQFAYQIATGMEYLASLNIVHRDLACRNILVGEGKNLKITDFGLSREVEEVYVKKTKGRLPLKWMAIESIDAREFTTASDVWSYGVVLWEIGTLGGFPYPAIPNQDLLTMLKQGHRLEKPDNCAPEVYEIMLECWQEHASDRPTFSELRNKFSSLLLANVDDPYMVLEVDDAKAYYTVSDDESSEQRESVASDDSDASLKKKGPPKKPVWAKPSNPYVETPAISKDVAINVEEETPRESGQGVTASTPQQDGGGLGIPTTNADGFDPYIRMRSSPAGSAEQPPGAPQSTPEHVGNGSSNQIPPMSMSLPVEHSTGFSLSMMGDEKPIHQAVKRTRSNPYVDDPGSQQLLDVEESNGVDMKLPVITENGGTENILEREQ